MSPITDIIAELKAGRMVVLVDEADRAAATDDPFAVEAVRSAQDGDREGAVRATRYYAARRDPEGFAAKATDAELWDAAVNAGDPRPEEPGSDMTVEELERALWPDADAKAEGTQPQSDRMARSGITFTTHNG